MAINDLRAFAAQNALETTTIVPQEGYSKENGKRIVASTPYESRAIQRWGIWGGFDYFGNGRNLYQGSLGIDYRVAPHWIVGASMRLGYVNQHAGISLYQGGVYTAFYAGHFWGVAGTLLGPNEYTLYAGAGYDCHVGDFVIGPVANFQWDDSTFENGFGRGNVEQVRVGARVAYTRYRLAPWIQIMYQRQFSASNNNDPRRENAIWAGVGLSYQINDSWSIYGGYSIETSGAYELNQGEIGIRTQF
jgi:hypothetical protein